MKKLIKSRKGAAMELAIGVMFLMMAFTIMLLSTSGLQNSLRVDDYEDFNEMVEVNDVGEYVIANKGDLDFSNPIEYKDQVYTVSVEDNGSYYTYKISKDENIILTIMLNSNGKITSWN